MVTTITPELVATVRAVLTATTRRFIDLVSPLDPAAPATAHWSVADTIAHLVTVVALDTALIRGGDTDRFAAGLDEALRRTTMDTVADANVDFMAHYAVRDLAELTRQLSADVDELLREATRRDPASRATWFGSARVTVIGLLTHVVNEMLIHGRDIALATGRPWVMPPRDTALFFDLFIVDLLDGNYGSVLSTGRPPRRGRIAAEFRSAYTKPVTVAITDGLIGLEPVGGRVQVRVAFDPATLLLVLFHRVSFVRALASTKLVVTGPRPWLLPVFLRTVRAPG